MGPLDFFWHLGNLLLPAVALGMLSAALAKVLWRRELAAVAWRRLAGWGGAAALAALLAGLVISGRDGRMATYAAMVLANALVLWWVGFMSPRRH